MSPFEELAEQGARIVGPLPLTEDNVEAVLDEMRPYLINDGGNVALREIDGATVVLELQGAVADLKDRTPDSREMRLEPPTAVSVVLLLTPSGRPVAGQATGASARTRAARTHSAPSDACTHPAHARRSTPVRQTGHLP